MGVSRLFCFDFCLFSFSSLFFVVFLLFGGRDCENGKGGLGSYGKLR